MPVFSEVFGTLESIGGYVLPIKRAPNALFLPSKRAKLMGCHSPKFSAITY